MDCGIHCLNNLLGRKEFTLEEINHMCSLLSKISAESHKHFLGGQFDVNVLEMALQKRGYDVFYLDNRKDIDIEDVGKN